MDLIKRDICKDSTLSKRAKGLYLEAFPAEERLPWWLLKTNACREGMELTGWMDGDTLCAITATLEVEGTCFLWYFAVDSRLRGKGYGSRVLAQLRQQYKAVYLSIECIEQNAPNLEDRKRRLAFYNRNGLADTGWHIWEVGGKFRLLSSGGDVDPKPLKRIFRKLSFGFWDVRLEEDK